MEGKKFRMQIIDEETGRVEASEIFYDNREGDEVAITLLPSEQGLFTSEKFKDIPFIEEDKQLLSTANIIAKTRGVNELKKNVHKVTFDGNGKLIITRK